MSSSYPRTENDKFVPGNESSVLRTEKVINAFTEANRGFDRGGNEKMHGTGHHAERIQMVARRLREIGHLDIRIDQTQVDAHGNPIDKNRPDVSFTHKNTGNRINIEYDNNMRSSERHEERINRNDPNSTRVYANFDSKGNIKKGTRKRKSE
ncbi:MAG: hypothetical protein F6J87_12145 [Spirulina sp. SIO3F2]|nr:hypothetical protein [Spirulina sp. SIO3F2]